MRRPHEYHRALVLSGLLSLLLWSPTVRGEAGLADLHAIENAFVRLANRAQPSVVAVATERDGGSRSRKFNGGDIPMVGSGVVISTDGLILTNDHVVRSGDRVFVTLHNGQRHEARIVGRDARSDLAVIRIKAPGLVAAPQGDLNEVRIGQFAFAMGNPFGTAKDGRSSFSYGVVSALGKSLPSLEEGGRKYYGNLIQTTADIHPGSSGGPLFDINGRLIGVNTAIESTPSEDLGYAIPISRRTKRIIDLLSLGQAIEYGFLGVSIEELGVTRRLPSHRAQSRGVIVAEVVPKTPAELAGLRRDDIILSYAAEPVSGVDHFIRMVGATPVGEVVPMLIQRNNRDMLVHVTIGSRSLVLAGTNSPVPK